MCKSGEKMLKDNDVKGWWQLIERYDVQFLVRNESSYMYRNDQVFCHINCQEFATAFGFASQAFV